MKVFVERTRESKSIQFEGTVNLLLESLGINPEEVLVTRGDELLTESDSVSNSDNIKLLSVISGG
jgi:sulfur carrier protein ThiS